MSRYYRRYYRRRSSGLGGLVGFIIVGGLIVYYYNPTIVGFAFDAVAFIVFLALVFLVLGKPTKALWRRWRRKRSGAKVTYSTVTPEVDVDTMTPLEFERYVAQWLQGHGYTGVRMTERYDWGVDIIARKDGVTWGVQVKHSRGMVKAAAVRQVVTALKKYNCDRAMVVTNGIYSRPAIELGRINDCVLVDNLQ